MAEATFNGTVIAAIPKGEDLVCFHNSTSDTLYTMPYIIAFARAHARINNCKIVNRTRSFTAYAILSGHAIRLCILSSR